MMTYLMPAPFAPYCEALGEVDFAMMISHGVHHRKNWLMLPAIHRQSQRCLSAFSRSRQGSSLKKDAKRIASKLLLSKSSVIGLVAPGHLLCVGMQRRYRAGDRLCGRYLDLRTLSDAARFADCDRRSRHARDRHSRGWGVLVEVPDHGIGIDGSIAALAASDPCRMIHVIGVRSQCRARGALRDAKGWRAARWRWMKR